MLVVLFVLPKPGQFVDLILELKWSLNLHVIYCDKEALRCTCLWCLANLFSFLKSFSGLITKFKKNPAYLLKQLLLLLLLTFYVTRIQSIKDGTLITVLRQCWTVFSCQTPPLISIMSMISCSLITETFKPKKYVSGLNIICKRL